MKRAGNRECGFGQCQRHPVFAFDGVGGGQKLAGRLAAENVRSPGRCKLVGGVRLPAFESFGGERPGVVFDMRSEISVKRRQRQVGRHRAGERPLPVNAHGF